MHLRLTDDELWTLVEMLHLSFWVATWNRKESAEPALGKFDDMLQKILQKAQSSGFADRLVFDDERQGLALRKDLQDKAFFTECYDEFRAESFWEEIVIRLADRDLLFELGAKKFAKLSEDEKRKLSAPAEKRYWKEFEKRGIERVHMIVGPDEG